MENKNILLGLVAVVGAIFIGKKMSETEEGEGLGGVDDVDFTNTNNYFGYTGKKNRAYITDGNKVYLVKIDGSINIITNKDVSVSFIKSLIPFPSVSKTNKAKNAREAIKMALKLKKYSNNLKHESKIKTKNLKDNIDPFWKDVLSRVGMDVVTPFINRFPGHSFVAYDNGLIWSKTMKIGFNSSWGTSISRNSLPNGLKELRSVGNDLSDLDKKY